MKTTQTKESKEPLGYIDVPNGTMPVMPMKDIFVNYMFAQKTHWEILRLIINIIIEAYSIENPATRLKSVMGKIKIKTQYKHLLKHDSKKTRNQDIKLTERIVNNIIEYYVEFQNRKKVVPPILVRSFEYFGLGISRSREKLAVQIWLLAEDADEVTQGECFAQFVLQNETTGKPHKMPSGILYVNLPRLAKTKGPAAELAKFLLGYTPKNPNEELKKVMKGFKSAFAEFKKEKELTTMFLSRNERMALDMWEEGIEQGMEKGMEKGMERGEIKRIVKQIYAKLKQGKTHKQIVEDLVLDDSEIKILDNFTDYEYLLQ